MEKREFTAWLGTMKDTIAGAGFYTDFDKVYKNVESIKVELNILNSLIGSRNIESDFEKLLSRYPEVVKCIPILIGVRMKEIKIWVDGEVRLFSFTGNLLSVEEYKLFDLCG